jgi:hypothetical protein
MPLPFMVDLLLKWQTFILVHPCRHSLPVIRPAKELDLSDRDVIGMASLPVPSLVGVGLKAPFQVDLGAFGKVFIADFRQLAVGLAVEPLNFFPLFARDFYSSLGSGSVAIP